MNGNDNGRRRFVDHLVESRSTQRTEEESDDSRFTKNISLSLHNIAMDYRNRLRKSAEPSHSDSTARSVRRAVSPENIGMQRNGVSAASASLIKLAQMRPGMLTGDGLGPIDKALKLPAQSVNAFNDRTRAVDGAIDAEDGADDEDTMRPTATVIGGQQISSVAASACIGAASVAAMKRAMRKPQIAFLR